MVYILTIQTEDSYRMASKFLLGPHYAIIFQNAKGFDIWGNWAFLAKANLDMGWHNKSGFSKSIDNSIKAWAWATINNAAVDYYNMCEKTGIPKPPKNLKIWTWRNTNASSTAMLRRVWHPIGLNSNDNWKNFFTNMSRGVMLANVLNWILKFLEPDITIGVDGENSNDIYNSVNHELSHASHFVQVGSEFWSKYIDYIITYGAYGDGDGKNAELCGIGEMWGYSIGDLQEKEKYGREYPPYIASGWIKRNVFYELLDKKILTKKQLYDCLTSDVRTYDTLLRKMYAKYPDKADLIEKAFHDEGISPNVEKPGSDIIYFKDKTVSSSQTINGKNIVLENVNINNYAELTLNMEKSITINSPFVVNSGSRFNFFVK